MNNPTQSGQLLSESNRPDSPERGFKTYPTQPGPLLRSANEKRKKKDGKTAT